MENQDEVAVKAFMEKNEEFLKKHHKAVTATLEEHIPQLSPEITLPEILDADIREAFNAAGQHQMSQLIILQMQTIKRLGELKEILGKQLIIPDPRIPSEEIETDEE